MPIFGESPNNCQSLLVQGIFGRKKTGHIAVLYIAEGMGCGTRFQIDVSQLQQSLEPVFTPWRGSFDDVGDAMGCLDLTWKLKAGFYRIPIGIHGTGIFTYIYIVDFYGKCR